MKTQGVRLADVWMIGPLMLWGGVQLADRHPYRGYALAGLGIATVIYNLRNYYIQHRSGG